MSIPKADLKDHIERTVTLTKAFDYAKKRNIKAHVPVSDPTHHNPTGQEKKLSLDATGAEYELPKLRLPRKLFYDIDSLPDKPAIKLKRADNVAARNQPKTPPPTPVSKEKKPASFSGRAK